VKALLGWLVVGVVAVALVGGLTDEAPEDAGADRGSGKRAGEPARPVDVAPSGNDRGERPDRPPPAPTARTYVVARVVDGDTIELANGATVRLVGIDTPEVGECGFERAADRLAALVLGRAVRLGESDEDRDGYGRLLRYVDIGDQDAGLRLIKEGLAVARYDSRDGYGFHPREPRYVAADKGARQLTCAPKPQPFVPQQPSAGDECAAGYDPCVPPYPPDVDCADVDGPVRVSGSDPHRLDADGDGVACE